MRTQLRTAVMLFIFVAFMAQLSGCCVPQRSVHVESKEGNADVRW